jgi:hypothetical protein
MEPLAAPELPFARRCKSRTLPQKKWIRRSYRKEHVMRVGTFAVLGAMLVAGPGLVGCEEQIAREEQVEVRDGAVERQATEVTETPSGDIKVEETKEVDPIN